MIGDFGQISTGESVRRADISGGGLRARILSFGASLQDLRLDGHDAPLVLGLETAEAYERHGGWFGAIAGRFANRIAGARFSLDGVTYSTDANEDGKATLHGGARGCGVRNWTIAESGADFVRMTLDDPDGHMGFPGNLALACTYSLPGEGVLRIELEGRSDQPTPINLAHHSYFNLDDGGRAPADFHRLRIAAAHYLPVENGIPLGGPRRVSGTPFDFLTQRPIQGDGPPFAYDHNYCLASERRAPSFAARAEGAHSGVAMEIFTSEPGLQFYAGQHVAPGTSGLSGLTYGPRSGFCLEPQNWPDAPNRPDFPGCILRPGETYRQISEFRFSLDAAS